MPRRTPVRELQQEETTPSSPVRRSTRLNTGSPVPTRLLTRRNSATEASTSTPKATRGRRSSLTVSQDAEEEEKKKVSAVRTRRGSVTSQNSDDSVKEDSAPKSRTRSTSAAKDQTPEVKTTRRAKSLTDSTEEPVKKVTRPRSSSSKKEEILSTTKNDVFSEDVISSPLKKASSENIVDGLASKEVSPGISVQLKKRNPEFGKIDLDLSIIKETSLTEEETSISNKNSNIPIEDKKEIESKLETQKETSEADSNVSDNSFTLQLSSSSLNNTKSVNDDKENVRPEENLAKNLSEVEPMEVDSIFEMSSPPVKEKLSPVVTKTAVNLMIDNKITDEIDKFFSDETEIMSTLKRSNCAEKEKASISLMDEKKDVKSEVAFSTEKPKDTMGEPKEDVIDLTEPEVEISEKSVKEVEDKESKLEPELELDEKSVESKAHEDEVQELVVVEEESDEVTKLLESSKEADIPITDNVATEEKFEDKRQESNNTCEVEESSTKISLEEVEQESVQITSQVESEDIPLVEKEVENDANIAETFNFSEQDKEALAHSESIVIGDSESEKEDEDSYRSPVKKLQPLKASQFVENTHNYQEDDPQSAYYTAAPISKSPNPTIIISESEKPQEVQIEARSNNVAVDNDPQDNEVTKTEQMDMAGDDTVKSSESSLVKKRAVDRTSITLKETIKARENTDNELSKRIHKVVDLFCAGLNNKSDLSINVSMEYSGQLTDSENEEPKVDISLVAADIKNLEPQRGSKRRRIDYTSDDDEVCATSLNGSVEREESPNEELEASPKVSEKSQQLHSTASEESDGDSPSDKEEDSYLDAIRKYQTLLTTSFDNEMDVSYKPETESESSESELDDTHIAESEVEELKTDEAIVERQEEPVSNEEKKEPDTNKSKKNTRQASEETSKKSSNKKGKKAKKRELLQNESNSESDDPNDTLYKPDSSSSKSDAENNVVGGLCSSTDDKFLETNTKQEKPKTRKLLRLSSYDPSLVFSSSDDPLNKEKFAKKRKAKSQPMVFNSAKKVEDMKPETSEVNGKERAKKRKHLESAEKHYGKLRKTDEIEYSKKGVNLSKKSKKVRGLGMRPSSSMSRGWEVTEY